MTAALKYALDAREIPYIEGTHDCALFVARWVDQVAGSNVSAELLGVYQNKLDGLTRIDKKIAKAGGREPGPATVSNLARPYLEKLGWVPKVAGSQEFGDVVFLAGWHVGIWTEHGAASMAEGGRLVLSSAKRVVKVWKAPAKESKY